MARVGEDAPGFFSPGGAGLFSFFGNEPTSHEALVHRRKIAEALAAQKRGFPKNVGEGLTYLGESIGDRLQAERLRQAELADDQRVAGATGSLVAPGGAIVPASPPPPSATVGPRAAADPAVSETVAAAEDGTEAPATRLSYAPEAPRDLPPDTPPEAAAAPAPTIVRPPGPAATAVSRPPVSIIPMQNQQPPPEWNDVALGAKPGQPMEAVSMRTVPDPSNAQLRASPSPQAFFDNAPSMPMEPGWEGTPRLGGEPRDSTFASRYAAMPADAPADAPQVAAADVPLPRPRPEAPPATVAGGPTFRTERNAEVGSRIGFDRAVKGIHPELQARLQAAYNDMPEDVRKSFVLNEGARTKEYQQYLYDTRSGRGMVARPGHSRHEQGEAVDVDRGPALDWLQKNGSQYGLGGIKGDYPHIQMARGGRQFYDPANPVALNAPGGSNVAVANGGYNAIDAAAAPVQVANTPRQAVQNAIAAVSAPSPTDAAQIARMQDVVGMGGSTRMPATASLGRNDVVSDAPPLGVNPVSPAIDAGVAEAAQQRNAIAKELLNQQQKIPVPEEPATGPTQAGTAASPSSTTTDSSSAATLATVPSPRLAQAPSPVRSDAPAPSSVLGPQGASPPLAPTAGAVRAAPPQAVPSMELPPKLGEAPPVFDEPRPTPPTAPTKALPGPEETAARNLVRTTDHPEIQRRANAVANEWQKIRDDNYARDVEAYKEKYKHFSASDSAWVKRKDEALQHHLDRQHKANEIIKQYEDQAGRLPAGGAAAPAPGAYDTRLGTEASPQRSGVPSIPPVPPGIAPDKWREAHTTKAIADTEAVEKAGPDFAENLRLLKLARAHPGKDSALGFFGKIARATPGTDAAGFQAITDQIAGKNFLAAYQQLRGTGAISEMEGKKAEDAQARLSLAQNKEDYDRALVDFEQSLRRGMERAQRKVNAPVTAWRKDDDNESYAPDVGERRGSMEYIGGNPAEQSSWKESQMSEERPWEDFANPVTTPAAAPSEGAVDWEDVGKGAAGGLGRGVTGTLGTGGTIGELTRAGLSKIGVPDRVIDAGAAAVRAMPGTAVFTGPSGADLQKKAEEYTGKFYEPHSKLGQYASTGMEFLPGAFIPGGGSITARAVNTIVPALASETAGQATKGSAWEPVARTVAGFGSGVGGARLVTPAPAPSRALQRAVTVLDREGVPLSAGERTGSNVIRWAEAAAADMPTSSGAAQTFRQNQSEALGRAVTNRVFDPAELRRRGVPADATLPAEDVMLAGRESLSDRYTDLAARNAIVDHPEIHLDMYNAQQEYARRARLSNRQAGVADIQDIRDRVTDALNRGSIPGDVYQATRSDLGREAKSLAATDPHLSTAYTQMRTALDRGMERNLSPADAAAWRQNNQRWANMKAVTPAAATSTEYFTPKGLAQSVRTGRTEQYARNAGDLDELARSAATAIKTLPNSGTAQRTAYRDMFSVPSMLSTGGGGLLGSMFGPVGIGAGIVAPHLASRAIWSGPGQRYLSNQVLPQTNRDLIAQMLVQQAGSQPAGIERNKAEREAYNKKQAQKYRDLGL